MEVMVEQLGECTKSRRTVPFKRKNLRHVNQSQVLKFHLSIRPSFHPSTHCHPLWKAVRLVLTEVRQVCWIWPPRSLWSGAFRVRLSVTSLHQPRHS